MTLPASIDTGVFMTAVGWTLLNFIWQGALIAAVVAVTLRTLAVRNPRARYGACCVGLAAMMMAPPVTLLIVLASRSVTVPGPVDALAMTVAPAAALAWLTEVLPQLAVLWIVGVLLFQTRLFMQWSAAQRMRRRGVCCARAPWPATVAQLCGQLGIRRTVAIVESTVAQVPMVIGWLRPVILVPAGLMTGLTQHQLRAIIAHELAHVRRHDYLVNLIQALLETLLFYHPAVWWLSNRLRVEREYCCDDIAVSVGGDVIRYARMLSLLDTIRSETPQQALASTGGTLMTRIQRLLGVQPGTQARPGGWMASVAITITVVAACSAVTLARPHHDEHAAHDADVAQIDHDNDVDVVRVLREVGSEDAAFFEMLRDAGLDNQTMLMILKKLGPDPDVQKALEVAAVKSQYVELKLRHLHEQLEKDVAAGRLSKYQATEKFHIVLEEVQRDLRPSLIAEATREMKTIKKQLADEVAAGRITEAEAKERAYRAHEELKARMMSRRTELHTLREHEGKLRRAYNLRFPDPEKVEHLRKLHDEIRAQLEAGRITEREAEQRIHAAARQLHELMAVREGTLRREMPDSMRARLTEIGLQIKADVQAGLITKEQGRDRMVAAKLELHEHYRAQFERRHADKRHNEHHD